MEFFPVLLGFLLGNTFAANSPSFLKSPWIKTALIMTAGVTATVVSGEYQQSWAFAVVDCSAVALGAWMGLAVATGLHHRWSRLPNRATGHVSTPSESKSASRLGHRNDSGLQPDVI